MIINGSASAFLARYDTELQTWDKFQGADAILGPVEILVPGSSDGTQVWIAGHETDGRSAFLMKFDGSSWRVVTDVFGEGTEIRSLQIFTVTDSHDRTDLIDENRVLMLTGRIVVPDYGTASAALYDGTSLQPFALTTSDGNAGSISRIFTERANFFESSEGNMPLVFVVLIGLVISLALTALIVVAGVIMDRIRKKREGYVPAPTSMYDRGSGLKRVPPAELLESLNKERPGAPRVP